ncbi:hypothetical protein AXK57_18065 [Tsukamurella pulmonis]|uniref:Uncharacterized protein n=1 Tax=Tsukamurella pulmonis TaxID=47312 RepID=A0A1H0Y133_9ACTN|nr:hypothetical protein [Tsukamurella pulmonis]KXO94258.1 hypothetical protein AXK56_20800 [Tsukamurella pulmonis]KXP08352.1 hypothetical protein AXK57_18065 [Tsukamurella pulmonis]RDH12439.1 hypothetical protein DVB88_07525 [Tsukamurella pulmonis]SDQ08810.1 hypothetical protein SAMN04489765_0035 [Tsukamurella pulmonis]SUP12796.1 Protein of uncharacterised function (DUF2562) [Tsukamurella pulmonis]
MATTPLLDDAAPESTSAARLSNVERLKVGLMQAITGPVNIGRALFSIGLSLKMRALTAAYRLVRSWLAPAEVDPEQAITLADGAPSRPAWRKPLLISAVIALVLAVGGVAFKLLRTPSAPPVAPEPPRVRPASGATGDSAPAPVEELEQEAAVESPADEDPRKKGE